SSTSNGCRRRGTAPITSASGRTRGTSARSWSAASILPDASARSSSSVKSPERGGASWTWSPEPAMRTTSTSRCACDCSSASWTSWASAAATRPLRTPIRSLAGSDMRGLLRVGRFLGGAGRLPALLGLRRLARHAARRFGLLGGRLGGGVDRRRLGRPHADADRAQQRRGLLRRLRATGQPLLDLVLVHHQLERLSQRIVVTQDLQEPAIALAT